MSGDSVRLTLADRAHAEAGRPHATDTDAGPARRPHATDTEAARARRTHATDAVIRIVRGLDGATSVEAVADGVNFRIPRGGSVLPGLLRQIDAEGIELDGVEVHRPTLDDVFLTMTGRSLRDDSPAPADEPEQQKEAVA